MRQWDEKQIEKLLTELPKFQDQRSVEEVYQSLQRNKNKSRMKSKNQWMLPGLASAAVLLLLIVLTLPVLPFQKPENSVPDSNELVMENELNAAVEQKRINKEISVNPSLLKSDGENYITIAAPDRNVQFVVPLTYMIKQGAEMSVHALQTAARKGYEERLGLERNIIQDLHVTVSPSKVTVDVKENHPYGNGSASENMFLHSLQETFRWLPYDEIQFTTNGEKGIVMGHAGELTALSLNAFLKKAYLIYQSEQNRPRLLVPTEESYSSVEEAVEAMKKDNEVYELRASIPADVEIEKIESNQSQMIIRFSEKTKLRNEQKHIYMLHAILLTARDFGYSSVQFEAATSGKIGDVALREPQTVPVAPNVVSEQE
jgi:hypothetical protein